MESIVSGIISLLPPVLALVLALTTKNIILALFCGILSSSIIINGWGFITPIMDDYMLNGIIGNASIFLYMFLFGAFLAAIKRAGGFSAFSNFATAKFDTAKKIEIFDMASLWHCLQPNLRHGGRGRHHAAHHR